MIIRDEQPKDIISIYKVVEAAFSQPAEARLVDQLRASFYNVFSLVAEDGGTIIGHVLFSKMEAPFKALGLAPVSVLTNRQRSGIGTLLIREGLKRAARDGWEGVFVLGDPEFYQRFGFSVSKAQKFASPYAGPHFMVAALQGDLPVMEGKIEYAPPFKALDD